MVALPAGLQADRREDVSRSRDGHANNCRKTVFEDAGELSIGGAPPALWPHDRSWVLPAGFGRFESSFDQIGRRSAA